MKQFLHLILLTVIPFSLFAQTDVTTGDFPYPGLEIEYVQVEIWSQTDSFSFGAGGSGDAFDFQHLGDVISDTNANPTTFNIVYLDPADVPIDGVPVNADVATYEVEMDSTDTDTMVTFYNFYSSDGGVFGGLGFIGVD